MLSVLLLLTSLVVSSLGSPAVHVKVGSSTVKNLSADLYGVFFEEINHAGQGGLHAQMIQNSGFESADPSPWKVTDSAFVEFKIETQECRQIHPGNGHCLAVETKSSKQGVVNNGYWGINLEAGASYEVSLWTKGAASLDISITSASNVSDALALISMTNLNENSWTWIKKTFTSTGSNANAQLMLLLPNAGKVLVDLVSLMPVNLWKKTVARQDLAEKLFEMKPAFVRFPGGCYVEGDKLSNAFIWTKSIGALEARPGHSNLWGYYSEDFLGLFEYLLLIESLESVPVWVINNGISHTESIHPKDIQPWVQSALDSIDFIMGPESTRYGSLRAQLGHPEPFPLKYVAIGNEDCGKPFYVENYNSFYKAIKSRFPNLLLIANCDMKGTDAAVDIWDFHIYTSVNDLINKRTLFDSFDRKGPKIFVSEYAVTDGCGKGNMKAAVAEAAWMTGLERNADLISMASYAPLFVNANDRKWNPDAIVFNSKSSYGTPSYWTQVLFSRYFGTYLVDVTLNDSTVSLASSASMNTNGETFVKLINFGNDSLNVELQIEPISSATATLLSLFSSSSNPEDENSFEDPLKLSPVSKVIPEFKKSVTISLQPWSVNVLSVTPKTWASSC